MPTRRFLLTRALATVGAAPVFALSACAGVVPIVLPGPSTPVALTPAAGTVHEVSIQGFAFVPAQLTIAPGDSVLFTNKDLAPHTVTSESGTFDSGRLGSGRATRITFPAAGDYRYFCEIHPRMRGVITVA